MDVRDKWLTEQVNKKIKFDHISGDKQLADILTMPMQKTKFIKNRDMLMTASIALLSIIRLITLDDTANARVTTMTRACLLVALT